MADNGPLGAVTLPGVSLLLSRRVTAGEIERRGPKPARGGFRALHALHWMKGVSSGDAWASSFPLSSSPLCCFVLPSFVLLFLISLLFFIFFVLGPRPNFFSA